MTGSWTTFARRLGLRRAVAVAVLALVAAGFGLPATPASAASPGTYAYVVDSTDTAVAIVDSVTGTYVGAVAIDGSPHGLAVSPDGKRVYTASPNTGVSVIDPAQQAVVSTIALPAGTFPTALALSPDGSRLYVTDEGLVQVDVIDTTSGAVVATVPLTGDPVTIAATTSQVYVGDDQGHEVTVIDAATNQVTTTIPLPGVPNRLIPVPSAGLLYVPTSSGTAGLTIIDTTTNTVSSTNTDIVNGNEAALSPDGARLYVTDLTGNLYVLDSASGTQETSVHSENRTGAPTWVAVSPDGRVFIAYQASGGVLSPSIDVVDPTTLATTSSTEYDTFQSVRGLAIGTVTATPPPAKKADVQAKVTGPTSGRTNTAYTYTVTAKDAGPGAAARVGSTVLLPQGASLVSASGSYTRIGQLVVWKTTPDLAVNGSSSYTVTVKFSSKGTKVLTAGAASLSTPDPKLVNNLALVSTRIQ